jgi:hypothetical protein
MQAAWDAAVAECLRGHENCSYGGMTPSGGYWLADVDCPLGHHDRCAWCPAGPTTGFAGWGEDGWSIWAVPACEEHAAEWAAGHPEWTRPSEREDTAEQPSVGALLAGHQAAREAWLAGLPTEVREAWLAADRAAENMLLWGNPDGPSPGTQPGKLSDGLLPVLGETDREDEPGRYRAARAGAARSLREVEAEAVEPGLGSLAGVAGWQAAQFESWSPFAAMPNSAFRPSCVAPEIRGGCYEASFGWVHVRPGCRCPR